MLIEQHRIVTIPLGRATATYVKKNYIPEKIRKENRENLPETGGSHRRKLEED